MNTVGLQWKLKIGGLRPFVTVAMTGKSVRFGSCLASRPNIRLRHFWRILGRLNKSGELSPYTRFAIACIGICGQLKT